jgi:hypothetical protein
MDLSEEATKGLEVLGEDKVINDAAYKSLVETTLSILLRLRSDNDLLSPPLSSVDPVALKQGYSGLVTFVLEGAKVNADHIILRGILEEHKIPSSRIDLLLARYSEARPHIRKSLYQTNFHHPHLVDADWRLDYLIKSNSVERINTPIYRIAFKAEETEGKSTRIEFACSLEQLQDLVFKLRDATKQIERVSGRS